MSTPSAAALRARSFYEASRSTHTRPVCQCIAVSRRSKDRTRNTRRHVSSAAPQRSEMDIDSQSSPRWSRTPPAMKAPVRARVDMQPYKWNVNTDPQKLNKMYTRLLGQEGDKMLSDETKWMAVTHKSFDAGRRGFNDRLAFLGKRILELQASLGLLTRPTTDSDIDLSKSSNPTTAQAMVLLSETRESLLHHRSLSEVASIHGIPDVVRWSPDDPDNVAASGCHLVYAQALCAIVGALSLEQGGAVASRIARERILGTALQRVRTHSPSTVRKLGRKAETVERISV